MKTARLIGGAGTGKTTELLRIMEGAMAELGDDPLRLGFASFTRAARAEAVDRASAAWGVPADLLAKEGWFRTVHSVAYRCLDGVVGDLLTDKREDLEWISNAVGRAMQVEFDEDTGELRYSGDPVAAAALNCWSVARSTLRTLEEVVRPMRQADDRVPDLAEIVRICQLYETMKNIDHRCDFTDLLTKFAGVHTSVSGITRCRPEGYLPKVDCWLFDEQQDASPLLDLCCKRLVSAPSVRWAYIVGDPFQAIYGFAGSSADCFMSWPVVKQRVMPKSFRCPKPIADFGERCLREMRGGGYFDRGIAPADHEGRVEFIENGGIDAIAQSVRGDEDWLLIARTNFHAKRLAGALSSNGIPCRWAKSTGELTQRTAGLKALHSLQHNSPVDGEGWRAAMTLVPSRVKSGEKMLTHGAKTRFEDKQERLRWDFIEQGDLADVGATSHLIERIKSGDWVGLVDGGAAWARNAREWGVDLACKPRVRVGTIHSVKGMEADNVALLTDTSRLVEAGTSASVAQHDEECRIAYVAVTRARRRLVVGMDGSQRAPRMEAVWNAKA